MYEAIDNTGSKLLIFSGGVLGPTWVSIGFVLEQSGIRHTLEAFGKTYFLSRDTEELRTLLGQIKRLSRLSAREEVFIADVGFLISDIPKKLNTRAIIAPAVILGVTVVIWFLELSRPVAETEIIEPTIAITCALDLADDEFGVWLKNQFENADIQNNQMVIQTDLGLVNLEIKQSLGSTQLVSARIECEDGRVQILQFRADSQLGGQLVELGERLDS